MCERLVESEKDREKPSAEKLWGVKYPMEEQKLKIEKSLLRKSLGEAAESNTAEL